MLITISTITDHSLVLLYLTEFSLMLLLSDDDPSVIGGNFGRERSHKLRVLLSTLFAGASW